MVNTPLRFRPYLRPRVWGGRRLGNVLGKPLPTAGRYGEAWEISDHCDHQSVIATGNHAGSTLRAVMTRDPESLLGGKTLGRFPWLVKYLDACDWLSVQVHPDDESAVRLWPGEGGKTEAWFILAARPGSRVYAGLLPGVDEKQLRLALANGAVAECLHALAPRPGDCLFLPAGTVHAVGGGVLIAEVQQTSDATFRLFDWNRRDSAGQGRKLHIEESLACIDWNAGPVNPVRACGFPPVPNLASVAGPIRQQLVDCRYFELGYIHGSEPFRISNGCLQTVMVVSGRGLLMSAGGTERLVLGNTVLLPAALDPVWFQPQSEIGLLVATLPRTLAVHQSKNRP